MIFSDDKVYIYPNKSIMEDVLCRQGPPGAGAFTPYNGMFDLIGQQFTNQLGDIVIEAKDIAANGKDFSSKIARPNDDGVNREVNANEVTSYHTRLEDIDESFIKKYAIELIVGYKTRNKNGLKEQHELLATKDKIYDDEDGIFIDPLDIEEEVQDFSAEQIVEANTKLPYLLKILHDGSIAYGGSLLSAAIALEKAVINNPGLNEIRPGLLIAEGIWKVNRDGSFNRLFTVQDNTAEPLRTIIKWISGKSEPDIYYKAYKDLIHVCSVLGIDLSKEDARDYKPDYIKSIVCTYIASNKEYLETYGFIDKKILSILKPENFFSVAKTLSGNDDSEVVNTLSGIMESIAVNSEVLYATLPSLWYDRPKQVNKFLNWYIKHKGLDVTLDITSFDTRHGMLTRKSGEFFLIDVRSILPMNKGIRGIAMLATTGYLVYVTSNVEFTLTVVSVEKAMSALERGDSDVWEDISL